MTKKMSPKDRIAKEEAKQMASTIDNFVQTARNAITLAQERIARKADKHRRESDFDVGD